MRTERQPDARGRITVTAPSGVHGFEGEVTLREHPVLLAGVTTWCD